LFQVLGKLYLFSLREVNSVQFWKAPGASIDYNDRDNYLASLQMAKFASKQ